MTGSMGLGVGYLGAIKIEQCYTPFYLSVYLFSLLFRPLLDLDPNTWQDVSDIWIHHAS
jgi:hypothetical protein